MTPLQHADPREVAGFRLVGRLGSGGMGDLYLGQSPGGLIVAVKLIRADLAGEPDFRARFRREVAAAQRAGGRFVAPVVAADPDGSPPWLAVEYIPGPSLTEAVATSGPLPLPTVRPLIAGLSAGLAALHRVGLVHRDLKPSNVLITTDGPRIIDFGVSRALDASTLTQAGQLVGSPGFMSPEQATGRDPVGPPSDVFALGGLICYALTGVAPFGLGDTPAVVYRVVHEAPTLDGLPAAMRELAAACMAKAPGDRPTAEQILAQLVRTGTPVDALYPSSWLPEAVAADIGRRVAELQTWQAGATEPPTVHRAAPRADPGMSPTTGPPPPDAPAVDPGRRRRRVLPALVAAVAIAAGVVGAWQANWLPLGSVTAVDGARPGTPTVPPTGGTSAPQSSAPPVDPSGPTTETPPPSAARTASPRRQSVPPVQPTGPRAPAGPTGGPRQSTTPPPPRSDGAACLATAISGGFQLTAGVTVAGGPNYTSDKCRDIHIKLTTATYRTYARSCLETSDGATITTCSGWILLSYPDTWDTLSRSVPARSRWQLQMYADGDESARFFYTA